MSELHVDKDAVNSCVSSVCGRFIQIGGARLPLVAA